MFTLGILTDDIHQSLKISKRLKFSCLPSVHGNFVLMQVNVCVCLPYEDFKECFFFKWLIQFMKTSLDISTAHLPSPSHSALYALIPPSSPPPQSLPYCTLCTYPTLFPTQSLPYCTSTICTLSRTLPHPCPSLDRHIMCCIGHMKDKCLGDKF